MEAANDADNVLSALFMFKAAKVYESMNQKEKALELYKNIKSKYPESSVATNIDKYIERVN
jgi:TolA-binding protein